MNNFLGKYYLDDYSDAAVFILDTASNGQRWDRQTNSQGSIDKTELLGKRQFRRGVGKISENALTIDFDHGFSFVTIISADF